MRTTIWLEMEATLKKYAVCAPGPERTYWLIHKGSKHIWGWGEPARRAARRFDRRSEAQLLIDDGYHGAGGSLAEVVEMED